MNMLIENDILSEDNPIFYVLAIIAMIGAYDIMDEILRQSVEIFSMNIIKKITLWSIIYLKTKSIFYSSLLSILVVLTFPKIFFGQPTSPRLDKIKDIKLPSVLL